MYSGNKIYGPEHNVIIRLKLKELVIVGQKVNGLVLVGQKFNGLVLVGQKVACAIVCGKRFVSLPSEANFSLA